MPVSDSLVVCADIGSISKGRFAWASSDPDDPQGIEGLVATAARALASGRPVALGFECPTWVPIPDEPRDLGRARPGEARYAWSGGPGATVLATGLAQIGWILRGIVGEGCGDVAATTVREKWASETAAPPLLLWEAFVAGGRKPGAGARHVDDAGAGIEAFQRGETLAGSPPAEGLPVNLLALLAAWAGLRVDLDEQTCALPIYAPPDTRRSP